MNSMESSDLAVLATLDALLQEGSVSGAARRLGLSAPAVSHALAKLRDRFGDPLLVRAGRSMVLTPRAEALKPKVQDAMSVAARVFEDEGDFVPGSMSRTFSITMTDYVLTVFGGALDAALQEAAPGLDLRVFLNAVDDPQKLRSGETDLAIGIYGELPPELRTRVIITDRFVCAVRKDHPVVRKRLSLAQFLKLEHIQVAPRGRPGGYVDELLQERGATRRVARAVPFFRAALELTANSDRVVTISERIARKLGPPLGLKILEPPLPFEPFALSMVWHPRFDADPGHRWLRERLLEVTEAMGARSHPRARRSLSATDPTGR
ncbi:MAG: LysR family transcriptional regulator [Myxococcota bacterium]